MANDNRRDVLHLAVLLEPVRVAFEGTLPGRLADRADQGNTIAVSDGLNGVQPAPYLLGRKRQIIEAQTGGLIKRIADRGRNRQQASFSCAFRTKGSGAV